MLTVACVLRSGGIYSPIWVSRLKGMVKRHLAAPHRFVCLTDMDGVPDGMPLAHGWPGWWSKMELFRLAGPVLFFDLDTIIVGDLSDLARQAETADLMVLRDFYNLHGGIGSGVMAWRGGSVFELYEAFAADPQGGMRLTARGDQGFIQALAAPGMLSYWQDALPGQIVSYKADRCQDQAPDGARVVCLHGTPKFGDMGPTSWARRTWETAG